MTLHSYAALHINEMLIALTSAGLGCSPHCTEPCGVERSVHQVPMSLDRRRHWKMA